MLEVERSAWCWMLLLSEEQGRLCKAKRSCSLPDQAMHASRANQWELLSAGARGLFTWSEGAASRSGRLKWGC